MNDPLASLQLRREQVLEQMQSIDRLRRGTLSRHFLRKLQGGQTIVHGPYFVLQGRLRGKKYSEHIRGEDAAQVGQHVDNFKRFEALAEQFVVLTDQITRLSEGAPESKKNSRPRKSPKNDSGKRKRS